MAMAVAGGSWSIVRRSLGGIVVKDVRCVAAPRVAVWCVAAGARACGLVCCRRDSVRYNTISM